MEMSRIMKMKTASGLYSLQLYYKYIIAVALICALPIIIMSSFWSDIQAKNDIYTDPSKHWQACLTQADYQTLALKEIIATATASTGKTFTNCLLKQNCNQECLFGLFVNCTGVISGGGSTINDVKLPTGKFLGSLGYLGVQSVIFAGIAHGNMFKALSNPSWLASGIALMVWLTFSIFTYYAVTPVLPVPIQTNATFLMMLYYEGDYTKYANLNNGDNQCLTAYKYVWVYLSFLLVLALTIFAGCLLGIYGEYMRYKSPNKKVYEHLDHTEVPVILGVLGICFYLVFAASKMLASFTELNAIAQFDYTINEAVAAGYKTWYPQIWFPFVQPSVDLTTLLGICACISILRGYTTQSISAFKLAAGAAAVYSFSAWPAIVGSYEFYFHNNFDDFSDCYSYFLSPSESPQLLSPTVCLTT